MSTELASVLSPTSAYPTLHGAQPVGPASRFSPTYRFGAFYPPPDVPFYAQTLLNLYSMSVETMQELTTVIVLHFCNVI